MKLVDAAAPWTPGDATADAVAEEQETPQRSVTPAPDRLTGEAFHGLAGAIVRKIEPHTEADPAALLVHLLAAVGNITGRGAYMYAGGVKHHANMFAVMVGSTAKGRKGTSAANVNFVLQQVAPDWIDDHQQNGLSSGEGLLWAVRDPIKKRVPVKVKGRPTGEFDEVEEDPGIADKRLLVMEGEFAQTLKVMAREGNTLSPIIRNAWDGAHKLQSMTKNSPAKATDAHISIIGHITLDELRPLLAGTAELFNGFANRFLWVFTRRRKLLPGGGQLHALNFSAEVERLTAAIEFGREDRFIALDADAQAVWDTMYRDLEMEHRGVFGAVTARSSAQTLRLAMIYAVLDCSPWIRPVHLQAAYAVWTYCEQTVAYIFGGPRPDANDPLAELVAWIVSRGGRCTARDLVRNLHRYKGKSDQADAGLQKLVDDGRGRWELSNPGDTGGRKSKTFFLTTDTTDTDETPTGATKNEACVGVGAVGGAENVNAGDEEGWVSA